VLVAERDDLGGSYPVDPCASGGAAAGVAELYKLIATDLKLPVLAVLRACDYLRWFGSGVSPVVGLRV
jgi:CheY-like chemotaxis protein